MYHIKPRYCIGPELVVTKKEEEARLAASVELEFYEQAIEGQWGKTWQKKAKKWGVRGIVTVYHRQSPYMRLVLDMLTGDVQIEGVNQ